MSGRLVLVGTPIGNLGDLSPRAREALDAADGWIVEDTRVSGKLQSAMGLRKPMRVLNEHTSEAKIEAYIREIAAGAALALLTDAGMPAISDPGALIVDACRNQGFDVDVVPGPSAVSTALALSGFFAQRYAFLGFPPRKASAAQALFAEFAESPLTLVCFESCHRIEPTMLAAGRALGSRRFAVCRELTKLHQQVVRRSLPEVPTEQEMPRRGEFTLVIEGLRRTKTLPEGVQSDEGDTDSFR